MVRDLEFYQAIITILPIVIDTVIGVSNDVVRCPYLSRVVSCTRFGTEITGVCA